VDEAGALEREGAPQSIKEGQESKGETTSLSTLVALAEWNLENWRQREGTMG